MKFIVQKGGTGWNVFAQRYELIQTWHAWSPTLESANSYRDKLEKDTREGLIYLGETITDDFEPRLGSMNDLDMRAEKYAWEEDLNYDQCLINLLIGLDCENIDYFMSRLTPENCLLLGRAYSSAVKERLGIPKFEPHEVVTVSRKQLRDIFRGKCISDDACEVGLDKLFGEEPPS